MTSLIRLKNMQTKSECVICADEVKQVQIAMCPFCKFEACKACIGRFLLNIDDDRPRCMNNECKKVWTYEFLTENFEASFYNKKYRDRRTSLLHEKEKCLLPGSQALVLCERKRESNAKKIDELKVQNNMYRKLMKNNREKIYLLWRSGREVSEKEDRIFTRACPVETCRGFLSTSLKCGLCNGYACKDCQLSKNGKNDTEHKCNPDLVATVKMLALDTKPCPSCTTPIFKINGCDQMYCTQCHSAFSWKKGVIERGVIHNPHFYEAQRAINNGACPMRVPAMRCGGPPGIRDVTDLLYDNKITFAHCERAHRLIYHINAVELQHYPIVFGEMDNSQLRVSYLMERITEKQWISKLKAKTKKQEKDSEFNMVLSMFTTTMSDLFANILVSDLTGIQTHINSIDKLRIYTNNSLKKIGNNYGNVYPQISDDYVFLKTSAKV